eukprot:ANDGO_03289.mRNA.1 hypothetical protein
MGSLFSSAALRLLLLVSAVAAVAMAQVQLTPGQMSFVTIVQKGGQCNACTFLTAPVSLTDGNFVAISIINFYGDADATITNPAGSSWTLSSPTSEVLVVKFGDPKFQNNAVMNITVTPYPPGAEVWFSVLYYYSQATYANAISLVPGLPLIFSTPSAQYVDYVFVPDAANKSLSFSLTRLNGDPDLYVGIQNPPTRRGNARWSLTSSSSEFLYINHITDPLFVVGSTYYTSVYGYNSAGTTYSLTASVEDQGHLTTLLERFPHEEVVKAGLYRYFYVYAPRDTAVRITVETVSASGDPDLYVSVPQQTSCKCTPLPGPGAANYYSASSRFDYVNIPANDAPRVASGCDNLCIGVRAFGTSDATFRITYVAQGDPVILEDGDSVITTVAPNAPLFYVFEKNDPVPGLTFEAQDMGGKCSLFVNFQSPNPSAQKADWTGNYTGFGSKVFIPQGSLAGVYYVGVYQWTGFAGDNSTCLLTSYTSQQSELLVDSVVLYGKTVIEGAYRYFDFQVSDPRFDVIVSISPLAGTDADLYGAYGFRPSSTNYTFKSTRLGTDQFLVNASDPSTFQLGTLHIAVFGWLQSTFSIVAYTANNSVTLSPGFVQAGNVGRKRYNFYNIFNSIAGGNMFISLVSVGTGDADLYAGFGSSYARPDASHNQFASSHSGGDFIVIRGTSVGNYYISVFGFSAADYRIVASVEGSGKPGLLEVAEGTATSMALDPGMGFDVLGFLDDQRDMVISVTPLEGTLSTFVKFGSRATNMPGGSNAKSTDPYPGNMLYLPTSAPYFSAGMVFSNIQNTGTHRAFFQINYLQPPSAAGLTDGTILNLEDGYPTMLTLQDASKAILGRFYITPPATDAYPFTGRFLSISVPFYSGMGNVSVSLSSTFAKVLHSVSGPGNHRIFVPYDTIFTAGQYWAINVYIRVTVYAPGATFALQVASDDGIRRLTRGTAFFSELGPLPTLKNHFSTPMPGDLPSTALILFSCTNDPAPVFSAGEGASPQALSNVQLSQSSTENPFVTFLDYQNSAVCGSHCYVYLTVNSTLTNFTYGMMRIDQDEPSLHGLSVYQNGLVQQRTVLLKADIQQEVTADYAFFAVPSFSLQNGEVVRTNVYSSCACERHAIMSTPYQPATAYSADSSFVYYSFNLPSDGVYSFCVVARAQTAGTERAYVPLKDILVAAATTVVTQDSPVFPNIQFGSSKTFAFNHVAAAADFQVSFTPYSGFASVFLKYGLAPLADGSNADRSAVLTVPGNSIYVDTKDDEFSTGYWFVTVVPSRGAVYGALEVNTYSPSSLNLNALDLGYPIYNTVPYHDIMLYSVQGLFMDEHSVVEISATIAYGRVDLFAGTLQNVTLDSSLAASAGPGSRRVYLFGRELGVTAAQFVPLYVGVRGARQGLSNFVLTATLIQGPNPTESTLLWGVPQVFGAPNNENRTFLTLSGGTRELWSALYVERCDNSPTGTLSLYYANNRLPTPVDKDGSAVVTTFSALVLNQTEPPKNTWMYYSVYPTNGAFVYSLTRLTAGIAVPTAGVMVVSSSAPSTLTVAFTAATSPDGGPLEYAVFIARAEDDFRFPNNLYTVCGCERNAQMFFGYHQPTTANFPRDAQGRLTYTPLNMANGTYVVNVVARSSTGQYAVYGVQTVNVVSTIAYLPLGQVQSGALRAMGSQLYSFSQMNDETFLVSVVPFVGSHMSVCVKQGTPPTEDDSCFTAAPPGRAMRISKDDADFRLGQWFVLADGSALENEQFNLLVYSNNFFGGAALTSTAPTYMSSVASSVNEFFFPLRNFHANAVSDVMVSVTVTQGSADVNIFADSRSGHPVIKTLSGPATTLFTDLHPDVLTGVGALSIVATSRATSPVPATYVISVQQPGVESLIVQSTPTQSYVSSRLGVPTLFKTGGLIGQTNLRLVVESCTNDLPPVAYVGAARVPTAGDNDGQATTAVDNRYVSILGISGNPATPIEYHYAFYPNNAPENRFSFRVNFGDSDPNFGASLKILNSGPDFVTVEFGVPTGFAGNLVVSTAYGPSVDSNNVRNHFSTACAVQRTQTFQSEYTSLNSFSKTPIGTYQYTFADLPSSSNLAFNILFKTDRGVVVPAIPVFSSTSSPVNGFKNETSKHLSGGSIFLILLTCLTFTYLVAGSVVQYFRGRRGMDVVPNYGFWRILPGLVADGVRLLTTCGASSYSAFQDQPPAAVPVASGTAPPPAAASADASFASSPSRGGYGSI